MLVVFVLLQGCMASKHVRTERIETVVAGSREARDEVVEADLVEARVEPDGVVFVEGDTVERVTTELTEIEVWDRRDWHWKQKPKDYYITAAAMLGGGLLALYAGMTADEHDTREAGVLLGAGLVIGSPVPLGIVAVRSLQTIDTRRSHDVERREVARTGPQFREGGPWSGTLHVEGAVPVYAYSDAVDLPVVEGRATRLDDLPWLPIGLLPVSVSMTTEGRRLSTPSGVGTTYAALSDEASASAGPDTLHVRTREWWTEPVGVSLHLDRIRVEGALRRFDRPDPFVEVAVQGRSLGCSGTVDDAPVGTSPRVPDPSSVVFDMRRVDGITLTLHEANVWGSAVGPRWTRLGVPEGEGELGWVSYTALPAGGRPLGGLDSCGDRGTFPDWVGGAARDCLAEAAFGEILGYFGTRMTRSELGGELAAGIGAYVGGAEIDEIVLSSAAGHALSLLGAPGRLLALAGDFGLCMHGHAP